MGPEPDRAEPAHQLPVDPLQGLLGLASLAGQRLPQMRLQAYVLLLVACFSWGVALALGLGLGLGRYPRLGAMVGLLGALGTLTVGLLLSHHTFLRRLELNYRMVERLERLEVVVEVPEGESLEERYLSYLRKEGHRPGPPQPQPPSPFSRVLASPGGRLWRSLGLGSRGWGVALAPFSTPPTKDQIEALAQQARRLQERLVSPLVAVALWQGEMPAWDTAVLAELRFWASHRGHRLPCEVQLAIELTDGTYELLPRLPQALFE